MAVGLDVKLGGGEGAGVVHADGAGPVVAVLAGAVDVDGAGVAVAVGGAAVGVDSAVLRPCGDGKGTLRVPPPRVSAKPVSG